MSPPPSLPRHVANLLRDNIGRSTIRHPRQRDTDDSDSNDDNNASPLTRPTSHKASASRPPASSGDDDTLMNFKLFESSDSSLSDESDPPIPPPSGVVAKNKNKNRNNDDHLDFDSPGPSPVSKNDSTHMQVDSPPRFSQESLLPSSIATTISASIPPTPLGSSPFRMCTSTYLRTN